jgi:hypothetical protein
MKVALSFIEKLHLIYPIKNQPPHDNMELFMPSSPAALRFPSIQMEEDVNLINAL